MVSRVLGEDTERIRNTLKPIDMNGDFAAAIRGKRCEEINEMLERSAIAIANSPQTSEVIMEHILSEGVNCLNIKTMGGMQHLITFDTFEDKIAMI